MGEREGREGISRVVAGNEEDCREKVCTYRSIELPRMQDARWIWKIYYLYSRLDRDAVRRSGAITSQRNTTQRITPNDVASLKERAVYPFTPPSSDGG
jgi:hypothetical protein